MEGDAVGAVVVVVGGEVLSGLGVVEHGEGEVYEGALLVSDASVLLVLQRLLVHAHIQVRAKGKAIVVIVVL